MSTVFLLQNQHKQLLSRQGEWVDGREASTLYRTAHRDEALNQLVETNARDYTLRMNILTCELNERGLPLLQEDDLPPLMSAGCGDTVAESDGVVTDAADVADEHTAVAAVDD